MAVTLPLTSTFVWAIRATMWVTTPSMYSSLCSMLLRHRTGDVRRGEDGEDERLQAGNEDLEEDHHGSRTEGHQANHVRRAGEQGDRPQEEHRQQEVAGHHVGEETDGQGDGTDDDRREELDRRQKQVHGRRRTG